MKSTLTLLLLSSATASSLDNANDLKSRFQIVAAISLRGASNRHQCYNNCQRHTNKSEAWIEGCMEDCDEEFGPSDNTCGNSCRTDEDCMQGGGFIQCPKCGQYRGAEYYQQCYSPDEDNDEEETRELEQLLESPYQNQNAEEINSIFQTVAGITLQGASNRHQCYNHCNRHTNKSEAWKEDCMEDCDEEFGPSGNTCGNSCRTDEDCMQGGGFIQCSKCGQYRGAEYYQQCYSPDEDNDEDETSELELLESNKDGPTRDDVKNSTKNDAKKTADWDKDAVDKTADWDKKTFDPNSSGNAVNLGGLITAAGCLIVIQATF